MLDASKNEVPAGFVLLQRHDGKPLYAACLDGGRFHGWLMSKHPDGQWVSQRKLESWEVMQSEDQRDYGIVHETVATKPTAERVHIEGLRKELAHQRRVAQEWFDRYMSAITPVPLDLSTLPRYDHRGALMAPDETGDYLLFNDVRPLLATKPAAAPEVPEGFVLVPLEPTVEQLQAKLTFDASGCQMGEIYRAMLAATPAASTTGAAQTAEQVRDQALEDAAEICDDRHHNWRFGDGEDSVSGPKECAAAIRALKRPTPTHSSEAGDA